MNRRGFLAGLIAAAAAAPAIAKAASAIAPPAEELEETWTPTLAFSGGYSRRVLDCVQHQLSFETNELEKAMQVCYADRPLRLTLHGRSWLFQAHRVDHHLTGDRASICRVEGMLTEDCGQDHYELDLNPRSFDHRAIGHCSEVSAD